MVKLVELNEEDDSNTRNPLQTKPHPPTEPKSNIPIDVTMEVLCRLRVKEVCLYRLVCKEWHSALTSSFFMQKHECLLLNAPLLAFERFEFGRCANRLIISTVDASRGNVVSNCTKFINFELPIQESQILHVGSVSCYGLLLLSFLFDVGESKKLEMIYLCNPTTKQLEFVKKWHFERVESCTSFGYVHSKQEYKIVRLWYDLHSIFEDDSGCLHCEILTVANNRTIGDSWKAFNITWPFDDDDRDLLLLRSAVCIDGSMFWIIHDVQSLDVNIVVLDLETCNSDVIPCPPAKEDPSFSLMYLQELKNSLSLVKLQKDIHLLEIWFLHNSNNRYRWNLEHKVDLSGLFRYVGLYTGDEERYRGSKPINIIQVDEDKGQILFDLNSNSLHYYNMRTRSFTTATELDVLPDQFRGVFGPIFESWFQIKR